MIIRDFNPRIGTQDERKTNGRGNRWRVDQNTRKSQDKIEWIKKYGMGERRAIRKANLHSI